MPPHPAAVPKQFTFTRDFQERLLGLMVDSPEAPGLLGLVRPDYFESPLHQRLARIILRVSTTLGLTITWRIFFSEAKKTLDDADWTRAQPLIRALHKNPPSMQDRAYLLDQVGRFCKLQAFGQAMLSSLDLYNRQDVDQLDDLWRRTVSLGVSSIDDGYDIVESFRIRRRRMRDRIDSVIKTQIGALDDCFLFKGPIVPSMNVAVALPGFGKTLSLIWMAYQAAMQGKKVLFVTLDMPADEIAMRFDACISRTPIRSLRWRTTDVWTKLKSFRRQHRQSLWLKSFPARDTTVADLAHYMDLLEARGFTANMLVVDYADKLSPIEARRSHDNRYYELGDVYVELQNLMLRRHLVVWTASQAVRKGTTKNLIMMDDIAEGFSKVHVADTVITLNQTPEEMATQRLRIFVAKMRSYVGYKIIPIQTNFKYARFYTGGQDPTTNPVAEARAILNRTGTKTT
jgi:KaiC/GvpD/RAD55 family RecA-like ATPase